MSAAYSGGPMLAQPVGRKSAPSSCSADSVLLFMHSRVTELGLREILRSESRLEICGAAFGLQVGLGELRRTRPTVLVIEAAATGSDMTGAIEDFRRISPATNIVILANTAAAEHVRTAFKSGAIGYVTMDAGEQAIVETITDAMSGRVRIETFAYEQCSQRPTQATPEPLTVREEQVLGLVAAGLTTREIAAALRLSPKTVETHRANACLKLTLTGVADMTRYAIEAGLIDVAGFRSADQSPGHHAPALRGAVV